MIRRIKCFLFLIFFPFLLQSQVVEKIEVSNNLSFSDNEIESWAEVRIGMSVYLGILDSVKFRIASGLSANGYFNPDFKGTSMEFLPDSQKVSIFISVSEGEPTYINKINLSGKDSIIVQPLLTNFDYLKGEILNKYIIEENINDALTNLENKGYPFASLIISSVYFYYDSSDEKNYADLYFELNVGDESRIDKIEIQGNETTKDYVIIRELHLEPGEKYSQQKINELPRRLNRLGFFDPVSVPKYYIDSENKGVLLILLKERRTNNFDGIIGYVPPVKGDESGYVTGLVNISLRNLFGTGRAAAFRWRKINRNSQELEIKYLEPWLFGFPLNLNLNFFQRQQDTIYVQRTIAGGLEYLAAEDVSSSVFISSESTIPTISETPVFTVYNSSSLTTGISLKIDTRDDPLAPISGILFENSYKFSKKKINGPAEFITPATETRINLQRFEATLAIFYQLFQRQVIALTFNGRELRGPSFEESDLFRLGGTNSLRGYREDQFLGNRVFWSNLEYRYFLSKRTFALLFFDTGYYLRNENENKGISRIEEFKIGYGLGLNLETAIGVLGVSFALAKGDSFSEGKIHFGIVNEF